MAPPPSQRVKSNESDEYDVDELIDEEEVEAEFTIANRLEAPQAITYTTKDLHLLIHHGEIDLNPPYQRDIVWSETKQMKLVDSLYHNYYVPPIVFAVVKDDEGEDVRRCVDGKQRLTSIQKFIDGQIPYKDPITKKNYWYTVSEHVKTRLEVPKFWKDDFAGKRITCVEYRKLPPGLERDIFQRVQLGIPLTAAEKLQAIASPWAEWISYLSIQRVTSATGLADQIDVDLTRGRDFQSLAQLVYCCDGIPDPRVPTASKLEQWLKRSDSPSERFQKSILHVLQTFQDLSSNDEFNVGFTSIKARVAPVEFIFIGVLLFVMRNCSKQDCAHAILELREQIRSEFKDIRTNSFVVKALWNIVARVGEEYETGVYIDTADPVKVTRKVRKRRRHDSDDEKSAASPVKTPAKRTPRGKKRA